METDSKSNLHDTKEPPKINIFPSLDTGEGGRFKKSEAIVDNYFIDLLVETMG